jgi:hypothetical protein
MLHGVHVSDRRACGSAVAIPLWLDNVATCYSRSMRSIMSSYAGLPEYHLRATLELLATTLVMSTADSAEDCDGWAGADFSGLRNPEGLR